MKFDTIIIVIGLVLALGFAQGWGLEKITYANNNCNMGCGSDSGMCKGTNTTLQGCGCRMDYTIITWHNSATKGSTSGSTTVKFNSVECRTVIPCKSNIMENTVCGSGPGVGYCVSPILWGYDCDTKTYDDPNTSKAQTCVDNGCDEEG